MSSLVSFSPSDYSAGDDDYQTETTLSSAPDNQYGTPETYFVFIVGNNSEWEEGRNEEGDIALWNAHLDAGVPPDQIVFVKDRKATKSNCEEQLNKLLSFSSHGSSLVFYYGGHGNANGFDLGHEEWRYEDVIRIIDSSFHGDRVVILADCCASGNLGIHLQPPFIPKHSYVCLMSSPPYYKAGPDWTMTAAWIEAMDCSNGKLPLYTVIDYVSDEIAKFKGDLMTVFLSNDVDVDSCHWLPRQPTEKVCRKLRWRNLRDHVPRGARISKEWTVGDRVCVKHSGKHDSANPPIWFNATIVSESAEKQSLELLVVDPLFKREWVVTEPRGCLLNEFYTASTNIVPNKFEKAQRKLANGCRYLDYSFPTGECVMVRNDSDECKRKAVVLDWREFDWVAFLESDSVSSRSQSAGPHIAVLWQEDKVQALVPRSDVDGTLSPRVDVEAGKVDDDADVQTWAPQTEDPQRAALFKSIELSGKVIRNANNLFGTTKLSCYWPEEGEWYDAKPLDPTTISFDVLATHCIFTLTGVYCPMHYGDDTYYLVPLCYIRKRKACQCDSLPGFGWWS